MWPFLKSWHRPGLLDSLFPHCFHLMSIRLMYWTSFEKSVKLITICQRWIWWTLQSSFRKGTAVTSHEHMTCSGKRSPTHECGTFEERIMHKLSNEQSETRVQNSFKIGIDWKLRQRPSCQTQEEIELSRKLRLTEGKKIGKSLKLYK